MSRAIQVLALFVAAWIAVPLLALAAYDAFAFQPRMAEIRSLLLAAKPQEKNPPAALVQVTRVAFVEHPLSGHVARELLIELKAAPRRQGQWHVVSALWWTLVSVHLTEAEQLTLYLSLSSMGSADRGFERSSLEITGVPLSEVSIEQAAMLVTVAKSPSAYRGSPERLARQAQLLATRTRDARPLHRPGATAEQR